MDVLNTKTKTYKLSPQGYTEKKPWLLKLLADLGLLVAAIVEIMPDIPGRGWIVFLGISFKLITKFISEHPRP